MTVDLEEQLRSAYDAVPPHFSDTSQLAAQARLAGTRRRRLHKAVGMTGGLAAATAIVTSVALVGGAFGSGATDPNRLSPAATSALNTAPAIHPPTVRPG